MTYIIQFHQRTAPIRILPPRICSTVGTRSKSSTNKFLCSGTQLDNKPFSSCAKMLLRAKKAQPCSAGTKPSSLFFYLVLYPENLHCPERVCLSCCTIIDTQQGSLGIVPLSLLLIGHTCDIVKGPFLLFQLAMPSSVFFET